MINSKYKLKIIGKNTKRYISELVSQEISLYYMESHNDYTIIIVDKEGYEFIKKKRTSYKVQVIKTYGYIQYKNLLNKYSFFLLFIFVGITIVMVLSNIVFDIRIEHPKEEIRNLIQRDLEEFGIRKYHFKVSFSEKEKIKRKIIKKETNSIEWLEIESIGTKYIVKVEERINNDKKKSEQFQNIVAKKNAMILNIHATHGEVKKKKYDYVKKGDVLISGIINKDDKPVAKTKAAGEVYGEVWYNIEIEIPKKYKIEKKTGNKKDRIELNFFSNNFFLPFNKYKNYDIKRVNLIKNKIIPISINYVTLEEKEVIKKNYTLNKIDKDALLLAEKKLKENLNKNDSIIYKKVLKKREKNSKIIVDTFFKVKEDITEIENIDNINIENLKEGEIVESND